MADDVRAEGLAGGSNCTHTLPVHDQVSLLRPVSCPPNKTSSLLAGLYAIAVPQRALGLVAGDSCDHVEPVQFQVSPSALPLNPPKRSS